MIRLSCPQCGKAFKVSEEKTGSPIACPRCGELVAAAPSAVAKDEPEKRSSSAEFDQPRGLFQAMSGWVRWTLAGIAGMGAGSLLLPAAEAVPLFVGSTFALLAILHGQATGCPTCRKWWSREQIKKGLVARAVFDENGVPYEKSVDQTTYRCAGCGYTWLVTDTEAHQQPGQGRPQPHGR